MAEKNNSLEKALSVLDMYQNTDRVTLTAAAERTGFSKAAVARIFNSLEAKGYVYKNLIDGGYYLGDKIYILGRNTDINKQIVNVIDEPISDLCRRTGFAVAVSVLVGVKSTTVLRKDPQTGFYLAPHANSMVNLNCSASGKVLVAFSENSSELIDKIEFIKHTAKTITDREEFQRHITEVKTTALAFDMEEITEGLVCVAVPVLDGAGNAICSISVSAYKERMVRDLYRSIGFLRDTAKKCEELINC